VAQYFFQALQEVKANPAPVYNIFRYKNIFLYKK
jgi:hypothetical protein